MAHRWKALSRRWKAMGALTAVILIGVVPIQLASGQATPAPVPFDAGDLQLQMNRAASTFRFIDENGTTVASQPFSASAKCAYVAGSNGDSLMAPSAPVPPNATGTTVGYLQKDNGYGLGVNKGGKEGSGGCTQTNIPETLVLELKNDGATSPVKGLYVASTDLDMEFKYNAALNARFFLDGNLVGTDTYGCTFSDCGPDSGGGDNYRVNLQAPVNAGNPNRLWDRVELTVTTSSSQGAVTLEGGSDGTPQSNFDLVELLTPLDCGTQVSGSGGETGVTITYLQTDGCETKGYTLNVTSREIEFITTGGTTGEFVVEVNDWAPELAQNPIPPTLVDPAGVGDNKGTWCDGTSSSASMPSGESWCLVDQHAQLAGTNSDGDQLMQVTETWLLVGDSKLNR
jgi:hypothetical protein